MDQTHLSLLGLYSVPRFDLQFMLQNSNTKKLPLVWSSCIKDDRVEQRIGCKKAGNSEPPAAHH